jgi:phosphomethylpyrimidine synthase
MNARPDFLARDAKVDSAAIAPLPNSRKVYVDGSRTDIRVPMREIAQSATPVVNSEEYNPAIFVYDCSGAYTDTSIKIDIRSGLAPLRAKWIGVRGDSQQLDGPSSGYGIERLNDPKLAELRFTTPAAASSRRRWNSSRFARM